MKVRTQKDVKELDLKIQSELGIEVAKYKNEEVAENFVELILFPRYAFNILWRTLLFYFLAFMSGFYSLDLNHVQYVLYMIFGLFLFTQSGILSGVFILTLSMKSDILGIMNYTFDILKSIIIDLEKVNSKIHEDNKKDVLSLLFKGVLHIITIPLISTAVAEGVPLGGRLLSKLIKKILVAFSDLLKFDDQLILNDVQKNDNSSNIITTYSSLLSTTTSGLNSVIKIAFRIVQAPLLFFLVLSILFLILFIYLL